MTEHSKPTPGPVKVFNTPIGVGVSAENSDVAHCHAFDDSRTSAEVKANANLIADAFNVLHETGLTPRELQKQRDELHSHLDGVASEMPVRFMDVPDGGSPTLGEQVARMRQALGTAEKQRDELLAALKRIHELCDEGNGAHFLTRNDTTRALARAAIFGMEGGAS